MATTEQEDPVKEHPPPEEEEAKPAEKPDQPKVTPKEKNQRLPGLGRSAYAKKRREKAQTSGVFSCL